MRSDLLDPEKTTAIMRKQGTGVCAKLALRFPPYGHGLEPNGTVIHRVQGVRIDFRTYSRANFLAVWECGGATQHPTFLETPSAWCKRLCKKCFDG